MIEIKKLKKWDNADNNEKLYLIFNRVSTESNINIGLLCMILGVVTASLFISAGDTSHSNFIFVCFIIIFGIIMSSIGAFMSTFRIRRRKD